ncbi:MAG: hypothetical protein KAQ98_04435 [Bacteriovoracaceae bacterium]|nr:hypothetical protein [Bacteriovoracaceae bacterium]
MERLWIILLIVSLSVQSLQALEIDEKLTCRILRLSSTKKTMLINRGLEDGLVVGDHAKFFITSGVISRGVVIKAAPTRSIWALYRLVNPSEVGVDRVINLKIAAPVKLTGDVSRAFGMDRFDAGATVPVITGGGNVELGGRVGDIPVDYSKRRRERKSEDKELENMYSGQGMLRRGAVGAESGVDIRKDWEIWGLLQFNSMSGSTQSGSLAEYSDDSTSMSGYLGVETYFTNRAGWYKDISPFVFLHSETLAFSYDDGNSKSTSSLMEFGAGINYHFLADPFSYNRIIGFLTTSLAYGSVAYKVESALTKTTKTSSTKDLSGKAQSVNFGIGAKYYFVFGLGIKMMIDYYTRAESYALADEAAFDRTFAGFRYLAGLSYRF